VKSTPKVLLHFYRFFSVAMESFLPAGKIAHTQAQPTTHTHMHAPYTRTRNCNRKLFLHIIVVVFCVKLAGEPTVHTHKHSHQVPSWKKKTFSSSTFFSGCEFWYPQTHTHTGTLAGRREKRDLGIKNLVSLGLFMFFHHSLVPGTFSAHFRCEF